MPKMLLFQHAISIKNTQIFYFHFFFMLNLQNPVYILNLEHISSWTNDTFQICTHIYLGSLGLEESRRLRSRGMLTILSLSGLLWKPDIIDLR